MINPSWFETRTKLELASRKTVKDGTSGRLIYTAVVHGPVPSLDLVKLHSQAKADPVACPDCGAIGFTLLALEASVPVAVCPRCKARFTIRGR